MTSVSFYIVAHADDWQLFMFPNCYHDLVNKNNRTVFIFTTAGDAGMDQNFWEGREEATIESMRFCMEAKEKPIEERAERPINFRQIKYWQAHNKACYFLRIPDGGLDGKGFGRGSLKQLLEGEIESVTTIDSSTSYTREDILRTLEHIIFNEAKDTIRIALHYPNANENQNPHDHPDHLATSQFMNQVKPCRDTERYLYRGYSSESVAQRLEPGYHLLKRSLFNAYNQILMAISGYNTFDEDLPLYNRWLNSCNDYVCIKEKDGIRNIEDDHLTLLA